MNIDPAVRAKIEAAARKKDLPKWRSEQMLDEVIARHLTALLAEQAAAQQTDAA